MIPNKIDDTEAMKSIDELAQADLVKYCLQCANKCRLTEGDCMTATRKQPEEIVNFLG